MFNPPPLLTASFVAVVLLVCGGVVAAIANALGSGRNFDILSGVPGLLLAIYTYRARPPRWVATAYNILDILLVANIAAVSVLCAPGPLRRFHSEPPNTLPAHAPWIWITLMVALALLGHLIYLRKLNDRAQ